MLSLTLLFSQAVHAVGGAVEREVFVPDDKRAIAIAKAVLVPVLVKLLTCTGKVTQFQKHILFMRHPSRTYGLWRTPHQPGLRGQNPSYGLKLTKSAGVF